MTKEIEIHGCIEIPPEISQNEVCDQFLNFVEANGWSFGGGVRTIADGFYLNDDGTKEKHVLKTNSGEITKMKKRLFVIATLLIMLIVSFVLVKIIDGMVQIDNDYLMLGIFLAVVNLTIGLVSYLIYRRSKEDSKR